MNPDVFYNGVQLYYEKNEAWLVGSARVGHASKFPCRPF